MHPRYRDLLIGLFTAALAVWIGFQIAEERFFWAVLASLGSLWLLLSWRRETWAEAGVLSFLVLAYILGNRGFAQVMPIAEVPLFFAELGLGATLALVVFRFSRRRVLPMHNDALNGLLTLLFLVSTGRMLFDFRTYGFIALRDYATIYYLLFFFIAQAVCLNPCSQQQLRLTVTAAFALLPITSTATLLFPDFFLKQITVRNIPLLLYKGDLQATFLLAGFVALLPRDPFHARKNAWRWAAALGSLVFGLSLLSRSSLLGLIVAVIWLAWAGWWRPLRVLAATCVVALLVISLTAFFNQRDLTQTKAYAFYEVVVSIVDVSGNRTYLNERSSDKGDNNQFRLVWWKNVVAETITRYPLLGQGFGADIARGFLMEYYPTGEVDFTARSPHNILVTLLGRLGLVGVTLGAGIYWLVCRQTYRLGRIARYDSAREDAMRLHAVCWVVMVSACFGVVLEGPMGAVPFWIILGLAHAEARQVEPAGSSAAQARATAAAPPSGVAPSEI